MALLPDSVRNAHRLGDHMTFPGGITRLGLLVDSINT